MKAWWVGLSFMWSAWCFARPVSLVVDQVPVAQVLQALAEGRQLNVVIAQGGDRTISLRLVDVPWEQALAVVLEIAELEGKVQGNILRINTLEWANQQRQAALAEKAQKQARQPQQQAVVSVRHADVEGVAAAIRELADNGLSATGSMVVDKRTSRLMLNDTQLALARILAFVELLDLPLGQVELAAHIVTINQQSLQELGVKWQGNSRQVSGTAELGVTGNSTSLGFNIGRVDSNLLAMELSALEQRQQLDIIARPRLITAHQQPASIKQGSEIPYQTSGTDSSAATIEFKEAVLGLEVTPVVLPDKRVRLNLRITQNAPGQVLQRAEGDVMAIDKQEIETRIDVRHGDTIVLGGIFQHKQRDGVAQVPFLGAIPLIGSLFRHQIKEDERRELVVFITTHLAEI
ncbi:secretin N-terminal domain-containing protein [Mangrovibacter yixingensis]|uniref:secretin N-terminal domain-containing protein n=1 Tax=Mangrovibacter yixingensis TaxID=1529639 RepID=UPI001CFE6F98|nr:secretin N-terminal domain-containing protein [Mangrovibacter yixingensis]